MKTCVYGVLALFFGYAVSPAFGQVVTDPFPEKALAVEDYRAVESELFVEFAEDRAEDETLKSLAVTSGEELHTRLIERDVCGTELDGDPDGVDPQQVCAVLIHIFENREGFWSARVMPIFALPAKSVSRLVRPKDREALAINSKNDLAMVRFPDLLPRSAEMLAGGYTYSFSFLVGEHENKKKGFGLPEKYFEPRYYKVRHR